MPRLFSCVNVDIRKEFELLFNLARPLCTIAPHITSLHIESLFFNNRICTRSDAEKEALRVLSNQFAPLILYGLRNLDTFKYMWTHDVAGDPFDYLIPTADVLSSHPSVKHLVLKINGPSHEMPGPTSPRIHGFKSLSTLSVCCAGDAA
ncbi:hypothetical protein V8E54_009218 [Elaphomyces granulatus]